MEYTYCGQKRWDVWIILLSTYGFVTLVRTFQQAGHVSKMTIKKIAYEGDISVRLLLVMAIVWPCRFFIMLIVFLVANHTEFTIINIFGSVTSPAVILAMIFSPKVIQLKIYI